jgi:glycerol-3-phosphate acyltransferase PlsY
LSKRRSSLSLRGEAKAGLRQSRIVSGTGQTEEGELVDWLLALLLGYTLGSVPFGLLLAKAAGKGDIRQVGSGNIGATNVLRTGSKGLAAVVLLLDAGKGFAAVLLGVLVVNLVEPDGNVAAVAGSGLAALLGHCFPIWLRFKGGKGVATMLGVAFAFDWRIGLAAVLVWILVALATRISSLAGMSAAIAAPVTAYALVQAGPSEGWGALARAIVLVNFALALAAMAIAVLWQHRANLARLRSGTEPKIGRKKA